MSKKYSELGGKKYDTVEKMLEGNLSKSDYKDSCTLLEQRRSITQISKALITKRATKGITQKNIADKIGKPQSFLSRFEQCDDFDMKIGDVVKIAWAMDCGVMMHIMENPNIANMVKWYAQQLELCLKQLIEISGDDKEMIEGALSISLPGIHKLLEVIEPAINKISLKRKKLKSDIEPCLIVDSPLETECV